MGVAPSAPLGAGGLRPRPGPGYYCGKGGAKTMKYLAIGFVSMALIWAGVAQAEDQVLTITGQVIVEETDADGMVTVRIVTETDSYRVHQDSKASGLSTHEGKSIAATGRLEVTEIGKSIVIAEYAVLESESPSVGAK